MTCDYNSWVLKKKNDGCKEKIYSNEFQNTAIPQCRFLKYFLKKKFEIIR